MPHRHFRLLLDNWRYPSNRDVLAVVARRRVMGVLYDAVGDLKIYFNRETG